jgi:hypothetical protein
MIGATRNSTSKDKERLREGIGGRKDRNTDTNS